MKQSSSSAFVLLVLAFFNRVVHIDSVSSPGSRCAASNLYQCPNCGGIEVSDCLQCDGYLNTDQNHAICFDRKLFSKHIELDHNYHYPHLWNDILGAFIAFLVAGVATSCGVGGGGIYVPLGIILLRFASKPASGLSQASIFGASLGGFLLNIRSHHPNKKIRNVAQKIDTEGRRIDDNVQNDDNSSPIYYTRPLIDYDMALFLAPMEMAGAVLGVIIQKLMPNWLFLSLAAVILGITSFKTFQKFSSSYKIDRENRDNADITRSVLAASVEPSSSGITSKREDNKENKEYENNVNTKSKHHDVEAVYVDKETLDKSLENDAENGSHNGILAQYIDEDDEKVTKRREFLESDSRQYPLEKLAYLLILWIGLAVITFLKGGKGVQSLLKIHCTSPWYPVLIVCQFLWTIGFAVVFGLRLVKNHEAKVACQYPFLETDVLWDASKLRFYASFTFIAGVVAGLIGIGGGMVLGPLMLVLGIHPRVSSATTATMIVLTSSSVAIMFVTSGLVPWEYAVFFFCVCFSGALVGKKYIDTYIKKTGMSSILIGILATIIGVATIGCIVIVLLNLSKADWCLDGFKKFCDANDLADDFSECSMRRL